MLFDDNELLGYYYTRERDINRIRPDMKIRNEERQRERERDLQRKEGRKEGRGNGQSISEERLPSYQKSAPTHLTTVVFFLHIVDQRLPFLLLPDPFHLVVRVRVRLWLWLG